LTFTYNSPGEEFQFAPWSRRYVSVEEVLAAVAFLLAGSRSTTGQIVAVDEGRSLGGSSV